MPDINDLDRLSDDLAAILGRVASVQNTLAEAKGSLLPEGEMSTRDMVKALAGWNGKFPGATPEEVAAAEDSFAQDVIIKAYGKPHKTRKSEFLLMVRSRGMLNQALAGVDGILSRMRQDDPKAAINVSANLLTLCRLVKKDKTKTLKQHTEDMRKKLSHKASATERVLKKLKNLGAEEVLTTKVGDEQMTVPVAAAAIRILEAVAMGKKLDFRDTPEFQHAVGIAVDAEIAKRGVPVPAQEAPAETVAEPETAAFAGEVPDTTFGEDAVQEASEPPSEDAAPEKAPLEQVQSVVGIDPDELMKRFSHKA